MAQHKWAEPRFAICIRNEGYPVSLERRKVYEIISDPDATVEHCVRVVDESGETYLFPEEYFIPIELPRAVQSALRRAS